MGFDRAERRATHALSAFVRAEVASACDGSGDDSSFTSTANALSMVLVNPGLAGIYQRYMNVPVCVKSS